MSEMVLPQVSAPDSVQSAAEKASSSRKKHGDSQYDSVSRAEQRKLDQRQADKRRDKSDGADSGKAKQPDNPSSGKKVEGTAVTARQETTDTASDEAQAVFTFADIQAWINPTPQHGVTPGVTGLPADVAGLLPGMPAGVTGLGETGAVLTQVMQSLAGAQGKETGKFTDLGASAESGRFESLHASLTTTGGQKLPEMAPALRGYTTSVELPVGHQEWGEKVVGKLTWLTAKNLSMAEIHLTPPDMGPMEVKVQVQQDQAHIVVHSANQAVRDQLEQNSHRLREMLNEQGIELSGFDVADSSPNQSGQQQDPDGGNVDRALHTATDVGEDELSAAAGSLDLAWKGEIDLYV